MQAGGRLVEDVDRPPVGALLQLCCELHALRLTAGQRGGRLTQAHVAQANVHQRVEVTGDRRDGLEELRGLGDRHVEYLGDVLALVLHLEGLAVIAGAVANLAGDVDVRQEVHLDLQRAVAAAGFAAPALDVEAEAPGRVATHLRLGGFREELAHPVEDTGVRRRVGARGAPDRALVHLH